MSSVRVEVDATYTMKLMDRIRDHIAKAQAHGVPAEYLEEEWGLLTEMIHLSLRIINITTQPKKAGGDDQ